MAFMGSSSIVGRWSWSRPTTSYQRRTSQLLRRKDHVLAEVRPRAARLPIEVGVGLADGLVHVHPQLRGDGADGVHRSFDLEVVADGGAVEHHFHLAQPPNLAELLVAEDGLESEGVEELDGQLEALHAGLHLLARLHAA